VSQEAARRLSANRSPGGWVGIFMTRMIFIRPRMLPKWHAGFRSTMQTASWLASLHELISASLRTDHPGVLACSALKERYRLRLMEGNQGVQIIYLKGSYDLIWSRMEKRTDHYMKPHMLKSQFEALEEPGVSWTADISMCVEDILQEILNHME
jgi:gluconokinase